MYARSSTLHAQPGSIDAGIENFRDEILPALRGMEGFVGASLIVDRESGMCIVTANWATPEARQASAEKVRPLRDQAARIFNAEAVEVNEWEIAGMHRDHHTGDGSCVRTTWLRLAPADLDQMVDIWKHRVLPALEELDGFCSASFMVNRESGRAVGTASFDSREALEASRSQVEGIRTGAAKQARAEVVEVLEHELALAHLAEPEMV